MPLPRWAAIDIGSNTLRLLLAEREAGRGFQALRRERIITRLAGNFSAKNGLAEEAIKRTITALEKFKEILEEAQVEKTTAVATGVVRAAKNKEEFQERVWRHTGFNLLLLTGEEEAKLMLKGILWSLRGKKGLQSLMADIGGWSTELVWVEDHQPRCMKSMNLGAVSLFEKFIHHDPPLKEELSLAHSYARKVLEEAKEEFIAHGWGESNSLVKLIGTAGTMTTLAAIDLRLAIYDPEQINNHLLSLLRIKEIFQDLISLPSSERIKTIGLEKGREDLILTGTIIAINLLEIFELAQLITMEAGLLEGILLNEIFPS